MHWQDWAVIGAYLGLSLSFAWWLARHKSHLSGEEYMIAGRRLPWWIVGIADVATGDGADAYWIYIFFAGGFIAYFRFYWLYGVVSLPMGVLWARYWRRLRLISPGQLYEERYGGDVARRFRAFAAVYGALLTNSVLLGYVLQGFSQIMVPFLGWPKDQVLLLFCGTTLLYTLVSGLLSVAYSDVVQFALMMLGRVILAALLLAAFGGLGAVLDKVEAARGAEFLRPYPPSGPGGDALYGRFAVEPLTLVALLLFGFFKVASIDSSSGAVVQRALAARSEAHAAAGQVLNAVLSLVVRVLPMVLVALVAVAAFPRGRTDTDQWADLVRAHVPPGVLGLLLIGIVAGYMSTLDGLLNFSAASVLNDCYRRVLRPQATDREQVLFGRAATFVLMAMAYLWARLLIGRIDESWINFINSVTGLFVLPLGLLRWTWWRLNIWGEIIGFLGSFPLAYLVWFKLGFKRLPYWESFLLLSLSGWALILTVTLCTRPEPMEVLRRFYLKARPPGLWGPIARLAEPDPELQRRRSDELRHDLGTVLLGIAFCAALVVAMGAAFARRSGLLVAMLAGAALSAYLFIRLTGKSERLRAGLETGPES